MSTGAALVSFIPDRHKAQLDRRAEGAQKEGYLARVRRPTRGIELKQDTFATLRLIAGDGEDKILIDGGSAESDGGKGQSKVYSNFLIQQISEERSEKQQIVETFGEAFIFFFGERPRVLNVQGTLINTFDFNWEAEWWYNYDNYLRGTKCVEMDAKVYLQFDETIVSGYILNTASQKNAQERNYVGFSFSLYVTGYAQVPASGSVGNTLADYGKWKQKWSKINTSTWNRIAAAQQAPAGTLGSTKSLIDALSNPGTAFSSYGSGLSTVKKTWNKAYELTQNAFITANSFIGNPVRVPYGFAGALSYEDPKVSVPTDMYTAITYTTFSDNADEFVTGGNQYSSARSRNSFVTGLDGKNPMTEKAAQLELVKQATIAWAQNGLIAPPAALSMAFQVMSLQGMGLKPLKQAQSWMTKFTGKKDMFLEDLGVEAQKVAGIADTVGTAIDSAKSDRALLPGII
jgi:hypothetical protein